MTEVLNKAKSIRIGYFPVERDEDITISWISHSSCQGYKDGKYGLGRF